MKKILLMVFILFSTFNKSWALNKKRVAIIGGGMAGVSTAAFLKRSSLEIHLFEMEDHLGGHARSIALKGANNQKVFVDLGPQYFAEGGWDQYIDFLKYFNLYDENKLHKFTSGFTVFKSNQEYPDFITPQLNGPGLKWLFKKEGGLSRLLSVLSFMGSANKFYKDKDKENLSIGEFLKELNIKDEYKEEIIKPLVSTSVNSPLGIVEDASMITSSGLLAFRGPLAPAEFFVSKVGLQPFIEKIAEKTQKNWKDFHLHLSSAVTDVSKNSDGTLKVTYGDGKVLDVDYVVFATHPYVAASILKDWDIFNGLWEDFTYTNTRVVIHNDRSYLHPVYQSFYNIKVRADGEYYLAMNLQKISPEYGDLIKSWNLSDEEYQDLKEHGHILAESYFKHPMTTPKFIERIKELKQIAKEQGNIFFAGGWSLNWENQNTSILSGLEAAQSIAPKIMPYWKRKLPSLNQ